MTTTTEVYFVVMDMCRWSGLELNFGRLNMGDKQFGSIGFLPVFDSIEAATEYRDEHQPSASIQAIASGTGV